MARPRESRHLKGLEIAKAVYELRLQEGDPDEPIGGKKPTQADVALQMGRSVEWVRKYWPPNLRDPFVTALIDAGQVGSRDDAAHNARVMREAGYSIADITETLGFLDEKAVLRLLARDDC